MPCPPLSRLPRWGTCGTARPTQEAAPRRRIASTAQPGVAQGVRLPAQAPLCGAGSDAAARTKIAPLYRSILYKPLQLRPGRHAPPRPRVAPRWTRCPGGGLCGPRFPTSQGRADWRRRRCGFSTGRPVEDTKMRVPWRDAPIVITRRSPLSLWFFASVLIAVLAWTFALDDGHAYEVSPARSVEHLDLAHEAAAFLACGTQATCSPVVVIVQSTSLMFVGPCQPARTRLCQDRRTHIHNHGQEPPPPRFSV
jgi:hypothetical protein